MNTVPKKSNSFIISVVIAVFSAITAGLCCIGPLLYILFGISVAGFSGLEQLEWLQIPMSIVAVISLLFGFWRIYLSKKPLCTAYVSRKLTIIFYWIAVVIVIFFLSYALLFTYILENFL